ncbi:LysM peptidoglycan-binding domain-containing protein [Lysinibacillus sp. 54212]|uniref:LysM peptidoglycan-binding domain-containing protein n=1 Tax=Lysinibacillus sp. 54212 TaxID=3119829 RepID=UPI002FC85E38
MTKEDYREKIEEHRQEVEFEGEQARLSRSQIKQKKRKNPLMKILLVVFIFIPLTILVYVQFFYEPAPKEVAEPEESIVVEKNEPIHSAKKDDENTGGVTDVSNDQEELAKEQAEAAAQAAKEAEKKAQQEAAQKAAAEQKAKEEEAKRKAEAEQAASQKTHVVKSNETLYRIAMQYYKDPNGVEKIKKANNLGSEQIYVGQSLIIP